MHIPGIWQYIIRTLSFPQVPTLLTDATLGIEGVCEHKAINQMGTRHWHC
jgi:hypothetical protein